MQQTTAVLVLLLDLPSDNIQGIFILNRKLKSNRFRECFGPRCPTAEQNQNVKDKCRRNTTEACNLRAVQNYSMYTCRQSSARQQIHQINRYTRRHFDRWASHRGGGASNVDAPGLNFKLHWAKFQPHSRGHLAKIISNYLRFGSHAGKQSPENVGTVVGVRLLAIYGGSVLLCCVLAAGCVLCSAVLVWYSHVAALTSRTRWIVAVRAFDCFSIFSAQLFDFGNRL